MHEIAELIREFPFGSFIVILSVLWACERVASSFINRNKPACDCECCPTESDDDEEEDEEDED